ncbi:hypothetical protein MX630_04900 [Carnobacterium divergens]|uniref:hypothetical protein n=1 Tax=Carnobacterium divergens TaxID=2748 RepID=UPI002891DBEE|nr:hypothetical protein [Carnobacterium divergens]MDT1950080.1 hypothetical protein [Carnobacterium divergens]MDT1955258.1 hypothetical protein [Carnobacterium divergens]MDT1960496.1 hypothetical protein [Carnobacterium divergens]MDT1963040.1 hypothetical protein [Carnobacterium divergens]
MRLREIQKTIITNVSNLYGITGESYESGGIHYKRVTGYKIIYISATNLLNLGLYKDEQEIIKKNNLFINTSDDFANFDNKTYQIFIETMNRIIYKSEAMDNLIQQNFHAEPEKEESLVVSLPSRELTIDEFNEITNILKDTFKMLNVLKEFQEEVKVSNFDIGTNWIVLTLLSNAAVSLFGNLITMVQRSQVGNRQIKALDKQLESIQLDEELRNTVRKAQIEANNAIYRRLADQFLEENDLDKQEEIISQIAKVTENVDRILSLGVGFEAAVSASNEVAKTFPPLSEQKLLDQTKILGSLKTIPQDTSTDSNNPD